MVALYMHLRVAVCAAFVKATLMQCMGFSPQDIAFIKIIVVSPHSP